MTGTLNITTPADKDYDWSGTWTLETQPFLSLAGTWNVYDGTVNAQGNPVAIRSEDIQLVANTNNQEYTYIHNGTRHWSINVADYDIPTKQFKLTETRPAGQTPATQIYTWDETTTVTNFSGFYALHLVI